RLIDRGHRHLSHGGRLVGRIGSRRDAIGHREVIAGTLVIAGLAIVAAGSIATARFSGAESTRLLLAVGGATVLVAALWIVGQGLIGVAVAQMVVVAADPTALARIAVLEAGVALVGIGTLARGGLGWRSTTAALAAALIAGVAVGASLQIADPPVVTVAAGLGGGLVAGLMYRLSRVTIEGDPS
ncbi:MAG: hypothetical protein ABEJ86_06445, partial [Halococcoides sp.]